MRRCNMSLVKRERPKSVDNGHIAHHNLEIIKGGERTLQCQMKFTTKTENVIGWHSLVLEIGVNFAPKIASKANLILNVPCVMRFYVVMRKKCFYQYHQS